MPHYLDPKNDLVFKKIAEESAYTPAELEAYNYYWDSISTEKTLMTGKFREGKEEGIAEGIAIGTEKGIAIGKEEGIQEANKTIAKNLLALGLSHEQIAKATSLSLKEIAQIQQK